MISYSTKIRQNKFYLIVTDATGKRIKQFMVTNCIVRATRLNSNRNLKNRISIPIDTLKESDFYAYFKFISFVKFSLTLQNL
jgi:hypothetical protein